MGGWVSSFELVRSVGPELERKQAHVTQCSALLRVEVGARALRKPEGRGKGGRLVVHTSERAAVWWSARACMDFWASDPRRP